MTQMYSIAFAKLANLILICKSIQMKIDVKNVKPLQCNRVIANRRREPYKAVQCKAV